MYKCHVTANELLTPGTIRVTLAPDAKNKHPFDFSPGQYAAISFVRHGRPSVARCFSIVSSPTDHSQLQFSMRARGRFTSALAKVEVGDEVQVRGPYGGFVFDPERHSDSIFIAGGIGITPFMSMVSYATSIQSPRHISLLYGVQTQEDIPFHAELDDMSRRNKRLDVTYAVGSGPVDGITVGRAVQGRITPEMLVKELGDGGKTVFICGPPPFMNGLVKTLTEQGVPHERIITEAFNQGSHRQTGKVASWPQNMYVLGALGIGFGSLAIMVSEIVKSLPNVPLANDETLSETLRKSGQREQDLDTLVNGLKNELNRPNSPAVDQANTAQTPAANPSSPTQPTVVTPTPAPAPVPVAPQPKCTTSQSGVTTCI